MRACAVVIGLAAMAASSDTEARTNCPTDRAVYISQSRPEDTFRPDELRFDYTPTDVPRPWRGFPEKVLIRSTEISKDFALDTFFTNNSGQQGIAGDVPYTTDLYKGRNDIGKTFRVDSLVYAVDSKLQVWTIPVKDQPAPDLLIFPGFWPLAHSSNNGEVSTGMQRQVFRFSRCEKPKPSSLTLRARKGLPGLNNPWDR